MLVAVAVLVYVVVCVFVLALCGMAARSDDEELRHFDGRWS
jgi:hypothetical protein